MPFTYETTVAYGDVGLDLCLNHRGLLRMMQEAAALDSKRCGYGVTDTERTGYLWILAGWRVTLLEKVGWTAPVAVQTWARNLNGFFSDRDYLAHSDGRLIAQGTSRWMLINAHTGRLTRITEEIRRAYGNEEKSVYDDPLPANGTSDPAARETCVITVGRRDLDTNHHVNNLHYLDYALEAVPEEVALQPPATVEILFRRQILQHTRVRCLYSVTPSGRHQVELVSGEKPLTHHAFAWLY